jgi:hypothetical protein
MELPAKALANGAAGSHVVRLRNANHYVFLSNESDAPKEIRAFLASP